MQNCRMPDQYAYACPYKEKDNGRFVGGEPSMKTLGGPNGSPSICLFHQKRKLSRNGPHLIPSLILFDKPRIGQVHTIHRKVVLAGILQDADT